MSTPMIYEKEMQQQGRILNREHMSPRASRYKRRSDTKKGDVTDSV
jgi:hypothetical protein